MIHYFENNKNAVDFMVEFEVAGNMQPVQSVAIIGAGNMASAIFGGMVDAGYPSDRIIATARSR